jgi:hypothetical protein
MREAEAFTRIMVLSTRRDSRTIVDALRAGVKCASSQIRACVSFARSPPADSWRHLRFSGLDLEGYEGPAREDDTLRARECQVFAVLVDSCRARGNRSAPRDKWQDRRYVQDQSYAQVGICSVARLVKLAIQHDLISVRQGLTNPCKRLPSTDGSRFSQPGRLAPQWTKRLRKGRSDACYLGSLRGRAYQSVCAELLASPPANADKEPSRARNAFQS